MKTREQAKLEFEAAGWTPEQIEYWLTRLFPAPAPRRRWYKISLSDTERELISAAYPESKIAPLYRPPSKKN